MPFLIGTKSSSSIWRSGLGAVIANAGGPLYVAAGITIIALCP